ncbi:MAG TPA: DNA gyrase inhibitor YacG [Bryobacteraceae bacterium]|nr:DNA gyrase inhibitor YacG [Bryobacteraceae bacterium]
MRLDDKEAPFCSGRCREIDLGNWATEKYVISTPAPGLAKPDFSQQDDEE